MDSFFYFRIITFRYQNVLFEKSNDSAKFGTVKKTDDKGNE
ncbi:hypothetical protein P788_0816 [Enterococcus faecalis MTUP9]|nr:hypothetical protein P788_0816 [Enterococcus faecalis MTUP9]